MASEKPQGEPKTDNDRSTRRDRKMRNDREDSAEYRYANPRRDREIQRVDGSLPILMGCGIPGLTAIGFEQPNQLLQSGFV